MSHSSFNQIIGVTPSQLDSLSGLSFSTIASTGASLSAVRATGSAVIQSPNFSGIGGTSVIQSGNFVLISGLSSVNYGDGINLSGKLTLTGQIAQNNALNLSGNLTLTGQTLLNNDLNLSGNLALTGQQAWLAANNNGINLSGRLTLTGQTLYNNDLNLSGYVLSMSGAIASGDIAADVVWSGALRTDLVTTGRNLFANSLNLSGTISTTGTTLWDRDLSISGGLEARMSAGGATVSVTGSSFLSTADFSGIGSTSVIRSGNRILISGAAAGAGGGVPSVNGITSAVTIVGTGNFSAITLGSSIVISGGVNTTDRQVLFDAGVTTGSNLLQFNYLTGTLTVGISGVSVPDNPLAIAGSGNTYIQVNLQNRASGVNAQADYVITADIGTDTANFVDLGINNSRFQGTGYQLFKPLDGFLYTNGGDMHLGTSTKDDYVKIHVGGINSGNLIATFTQSGMHMPEANNTGIRFGDLLISTQRYANKAFIDLNQPGIDRMVMQPALWNRQFTAAFPATTTSQTLFGNTAANAGTLSTIADQIQGQYTNVVTAATLGSPAGLSFTTAYYLRGTITGHNGFFFSTKFALPDGSNPTGAYRTSGARFFAGVTDQLLTVTTTAPNPAGNRAGLSFCYSTGGVAANRWDNEWMWSVKDNTTEFTGTLGMNIQTGFYRFSMYCPPYTAGPSGIYYQMDDLIRGSGCTGIMTGYLPAGATALRPSIGISAISGGARNIRINNLYIESANGAFDAGSTNF